MYTSDDEGWVFVGKKPLNPQDKLTIKILDEYYANRENLRKPQESKILKSKGGAPCQSKRKYKVTFQ